MSCNDLWALVIVMMIVMMLTTGCAAARFHQADRPAVTPATPLALPDWPRAHLIICPRGHWDPQAQCPWGSQWVGYDSNAADALQEFAIAGRANTKIATLQAQQITALDAEAAAANDTAGTLENQINANSRGRLLERIGWGGAIVLILVLAL